MTDNPWLPIDTMPLSTIGTEVDLKNGDYEWTITVTRIERLLIIWPIHIYCWAAPHINRLRAVSSFRRRD